MHQVEWVSSFDPVAAAELLLISTHRSAYRVTIANDIAATNPAGINAPPEIHRLPMTPANTAATPSERWKFDGFCDV